MTEPTPGYEDGEDVVGHGEPALTPQEQDDWDDKVAEGDVLTPIALRPADESKDQW